MLDGKVIGDCMPRHRHQEFIRFLKRIDSETPAQLALHLIVDNYGPPKHPRVQTWLERHPRFHLHFIPTSSSWLNMVERWFREMTEKRLRRGTFANVDSLIKAIMDYIHNHNQNPQAFVWTATAERIMGKIANVKKRWGHYTRSFLSRHLPSPGQLFSVYIDSKGHYPIGKSGRFTLKPLSGHPLSIRLPFDFSQ
jgi:transposase